MVLYKSYRIVKHYRTVSPANVWERMNGQLLMLYLCIVRRENEFFDEKTKYFAAAAEVSKSIVYRLNS